MSSAKHLVIVESPAKAKTIGKYLGADYRVLASFGHVRDLPEGGLNVDIDNGFLPKYEISKSKEKVIRELKDAAKGASHIYLASDPDREGEAIAWHLQEVLAKVSKAAFERVSFHEITKPAILAAFKQAHKLNMHKVDAQQARRVLDRIVGYQVSPLLWRRFNRQARSAGRVQTVALRLIVDREKEVRAFQTREYWSIQGRFTEAASGAAFTAKLAKIDAADPEIPNQARAEEILSDLRKAAYKVEGLRSKEVQRRAPPPFITSTLQQAASSHLRLSPAQSMRLAQDLYEGVELGDEGPTGLITYMRTDSVNISKDAQEHALDYIRSTYGASYAPKAANRFKSKSSAQEAHEAIRPTDVSRTPESLRAHLEKDALALYTLIWRRFLASQMAPALFRQDTVDISSSGKGVKHAYLFRLCGSVCLFAGFLKAYDFKEEGEDGDDEGSGQIPALTAGSPCQPQGFDPKQHFTEPPPRYSEATLVKALEANGVGRPSTYATIIKTIMDREYVFKDKGKLQPSEIGEASCDFLVSSIPQLFEVGFTAAMERKLDGVEEGSIAWTAMMGEFYGQFQTWLSGAKAVGAPPNDSYRGILDLFPADFTYDPPAKVGRRTYDDAEFIQSLRTRLDEGSALSEKQWQALVKTLARYAERLTGVQDTLARLGLDPATATPTVKTAAEPLSASTGAALKELFGALSKVEYEKPRKVGPRTYDDGKFVKSLADQFKNQAALSDKQLGALVKIASKYGIAAGGVQTAAQENGTEAAPAAADPAATARIARLIAAAEGVTEWPEPTTRGRRTFNDRDFVKSLTDQFKGRGSLSDKQVAALEKTLRRLKDKIPAALLPEGF